MLKQKKTRLDVVDNMQPADRRRWKLFVNHDATPLIVDIKGLYCLAYAINLYFFSVACRRGRYEKDENAAGFTIRPVLHQGVFQYDVFFKGAIVAHCNEKTLDDIAREATRVLFSVVEEIKQ